MIKQNEETLAGAACNEAQSEFDRLMAEAVKTPLESKSVIEVKTEFHNLLAKAVGSQQVEQVAEAFGIDLSEYQQERVHEMLTREMDWDEIAEMIGEEPVRDPSDYIRCCVCRDLKCTIGPFFQMKRG